MTCGMVDGDVLLLQERGLGDPHVVLDQMIVHVDLVRTYLDGCRVIDHRDVVQASHLGRHERHVHRVCVGPNEQSIHLQQPLDLLGEDEVHSCGPCPPRHLGISKVHSIARHC